MRIAVIGNGGGGKSTLSKRMAKRWRLPRTEVDDLQFALDSWERVPVEQVTQRLRAIQQGPRWLIDGFGPLDVIQERLALADRVVFIDLPLWQHYTWAAERLIASHQGAKPMGNRPPQDTATLFQIIWRVHQEIRPLFLEWTRAHQGKTDVLGTVEAVQNYTGGTA